MATTELGARARGLVDRAWRGARGIRARVVVGYVALLLVALVIGFLSTRQLLYTRLDRQIERDLVQETEELRSLATGNDPQTGLPFHDDAAAIFETFLARSVPVDGEAFFTIVGGAPLGSSTNPPAPLLDDPDLVARWSALEAPLRLNVRTADAGVARTLAVPLRVGADTPGVFVVAAFPADAQAELDEALRLIAIVFGAVLVVSGVVAWSLAGRVVRPVRELTDTARQISDSDLSARIPVEGHDEVAELGVTFNAMLDRLETGMRDQRQFLDDVAHELRTPITIIRGHLEVSGTDPSERAATVALVTDELDRMSRYVDDLLLLARAEEPQFFHLAPVDLGELAQRLLDLAPSLGDRRWTLDAAPRVGLRAAIADGGRLEQAMLNLGANAVQHTAPGDEIGIGVAAEDDRVQLWVRDTGPGVPPDQRERIFDRLARGAGSRATRPDGVGIGLAIVTVIAAAHRGTVSLTDTPGGGATFTIDISIDPEDEDL